MAEGVFTTILVASITAVVSGTVAFIFGRMQEKAKGRDERRKQLDERRMQAFDEIRIKALSIIKAFESWTTQAANQDFESGYVQELVKEAKDLVKKGDDISQEMSRLEGYYQAQKPYLEPATRNTFESFDREFRSQHRSLWNQVRTLELTFEGIIAIYDAISPGTAKSFIPFYFAFRVVQTSLGKGATAKELHRQREKMREAVKAFSEAAQATQNWDTQAHVDALDAEAERLANT